MTTLTVRRATKLDIGAVLAITTESFGPVSFEKNIEDRYGLINGETWVTRKSRHLESDFDHPEGVILVAEDSGVVIGYITLRLDKETGIGRIPNLAVQSDSRNRGAGKQLINKALELMKSEGMEIARIETLAQNEVGQYLYPQQGFEEIARQIYYCCDLR